MGFLRILLVVCIILVVVAEGRRRDSAKVKREKKELKKAKIEKKKLEKIKKEAQELDKELEADVSKRATKVTSAIGKVENRSEIYRKRMVMWLNNEAKYLGQWFKEQGEKVEKRAQEKIDDPSLQDEEVDKYLMGERTRIAKAKKVVDDTLQEASAEFLEKEESAVGDLVTGLDGAATDLYKSVTVAKVDLDSKKEKNLGKVKGDLDKGFKKAIVRIYRGVKRSRYDYRQGLYKARKMIKDAKDAALQLLAL